MLPWRRRKKQPKLCSLLILNNAVGNIPVSIWVVFGGDVLSSFVILRKEASGLESEVGLEPVARGGTVEMVGVSAQIDKKPKTAGGNGWENLTKSYKKNLITKSLCPLNISVTAISSKYILDASVKHKSWFY